MKRLVAQIKESTKEDYDPEERGEVVGVGEHHGGSIQVYMAHKVTKLREVQASSWKDQASNMFKGCIIYINGLTDPPIDEMRRIIGINGGECIQYRAVKITHFVCNYFTDAQLKHEYAKIKLNANNRVHYIVAAWVTESIKAGRRLEESSFVPDGMSKQNGETITSLFGPTHSTSSSSSSTTERLKTKIQRIDYHGSSSRVLPVSTDQMGLTASQDDFLTSLPEELRQDALFQIQSIHFAQLASEEKELQINNDSSGRNGGSSSSSSSSSGSGSSGSSSGIAGVTLHSRPGDNTAITDDQCSQSTEVSLSANIRKRGLTELVHHLHRNADGGHCSSKVTRQRVAEYVQSLLQELMDVRCGSGEAINCSALEELLIDYMRWLIRSSMYDQAQNFSSEIRRHARTHLDLLANKSREDGSDSNAPAHRAALLGLVDAVQSTAAQMHGDCAAVQFNFKPSS